MTDYSNLYNQNQYSSVRLKIICLGDSAVGKSNCPRQLSTHALTLYKHETVIDGETIYIAGQEIFENMHASYYYQAHVCIFVFDITRKITYKNLPKWYEELREHRPGIPCICLANKIDADKSATKMNFNFAKKNNMAFYFVSASDGTNVVKAFQDAIRIAIYYKKNSVDIMDQIIEELENVQLQHDEVDVSTTLKGR